MRLTDSSACRMPAFISETHGCAIEMSALDGDILISIVADSGVAEAG